MYIKAGDTVKCNTPIGELEKNMLYVVKEVIVPKNAVPSIDNITLYLEGLKIHYYAFRFEVVEKQEPPTAKEAVLIKEAFDKIDLEYPGYTLGPVDVWTETPTASKNDQSKIDLSLIPKISNIEHARAFMVGEKKYGRYNYCKGHKASQLIAAAKRHLDAWFEGEDNDPVDGQHHLGSVMACCSMILRQEELGSLKDDRYYKPGTEV